MRPHLAQKSCSGGLGVPENGRGGSFIGAPSLTIKKFCSM